MPAERSHTNLTDEELIARYRQQQDNTWLGYLLQRYTALLLGVAMKYLKDKQIAEDAVQAVFLKALTHLPKDEILNFKGWLYVLMRNHCLQALREKTHITTEDALTNMPGGDALEEIAQTEYTIAQMNEALNTLPPEQRECINAFYLEKLSYNQVMERTGYGFMQVKSYIQNGKRKLKIMLLQKLKEKE